MRLGMTGSPTFLVDGVDPFAVPGAPASVACRLYRRPDGRAEGAPSVADLRRALSPAGSALALDAAGRAGQGHRAPADGGLSDVQQAVLRHFATTGGTLQPADPEPTAAAHGRTAADVLADLAAEDCLALDARGRIRAAYPFPAVPTAHRVQLANGVEVWSVYAVDALSIPGMLATDAVITSADPVTGETITVTSTGGRMTWQPSTAPWSTSGSAPAPVLRPRSPAAR